MKTKQHIKSAADFSAICWSWEWICSLNRAAWQSPCVCCFTVSWWRWGWAVSCLITVSAELKWSVSLLFGGEVAGRKIGALLILLSRLPRGGVGRYYEEWWAGVGGSLRCKVLHLVPHWAVERWGPNRWYDSPSETSHRLSSSTQGTQFKLCGPACFSWLVPLVLSVLNMRSWINIIDIAQMNYS